MAATRAGAARFADPAVAEAEGYLPITPFAFYGIRAAHYTTRRTTATGSSSIRSVPRT